MTIRGETAHLLRRAGFGGTPAEITALSAMTRDQQIAAALRVRQTTPAPPPQVADPATETWWKLVAIQDWWFDRMRDSSFTDTTKPSPIVEKMTMFWHNHFATSADKVFSAWMMMEQNALFRQHGLGNFRTLCQRMAVQPAMLTYLDNESNTKWSPNQNFARELMELFMLGVGNYTEADVAAGAAAWSGHQMAYDANWNATGYAFYPENHDTEVRTFLGRTQVWDGPQTIDWILDNPVTAPIAAKFICRKLWTWLAHPNPPQAVVNTLATVFRNNNWEILPVLRAMFRRPEFWTDTCRNGLVRTPVEFLVAIGRALGLRSPQLPPSWFLYTLGQQLLYPPNVSGWRPNDYWISTSAMASRADIAGSATWNTVGEGGIDPNFMSDWFDDNAEPQLRPAAADVVAATLERFGVTDPAPETVATLTNWCTANRHPWTEAEPWNFWGERVHMMQLVMLCPDFQLA